MKIDPCHWIRDRLPLLAGGDLVADERRRVERHLIGCPGCRERRRATQAALDALRSVASASTLATDIPASLWPALARQIRESRHVPASASPSWLDRLDAIRMDVASISWPAVGMALSLGGVVLAAVTTHRLEHRPSPRTALAEQVAPVDTEAAPPVALQARPLAGPGPGALPEPAAGSLGLLTQQGQPDPFRAPPSLRFEYELERGTPSESGSRDPQHSY